jgi:hypothetical protein
MKKVTFLLMVALAVVVTFFAWDYLRKEAQHRRELRTLQEIIKRLTAQERVAQVVVKNRTVDPSGAVVTRLEFLEWDRAGKRLPPVFATLTGKEVYFEALVVKFRDEYVEKGDALRGKAIILFRRIFGSSQAPDQGVLIDPKPEDGIPCVYRVDEKPSPFEVGLWKRFWDYAEHPEEAAKLGVSVMECKAVGNRLTANSVWDLKVEAGGEIHLVPASRSAE